MKRRRIFLLNDQTSPRINAELACEIGLNESIILLQFEFWQSISEHSYEDKIWFYKSIPEIRETFRFWSIETVKRTVAEIIRKNYVHKGNFNKSKFDKTAWYSLNFEELGKLKSVRISDQVNLTSSNENIMISDKVNLTSSRVSICPYGKEQFDTMGRSNLTLSTHNKEYTENTDRQTDREKSQSVSQSVSFVSEAQSIFEKCKRQSKGIQDLIESAVKQHGKEYVLYQVEYCNAECRNLRAYRKLLSDAIIGDYGTGWKDDALFSSQLSEKEKASLKAREAVNNAERKLYDQAKEHITKSTDKVKTYMQSISKDEFEKIKSEFVEKAINSLDTKKYKFFDGMKVLSISERRQEFKRAGFESRIISRTFNSFILKEYVERREYEQGCV